MLQTHEITTRDGITARHYDGPDLRMVHDGAQVLAWILPPGLTSTGQPYLVTGTEAELRAEAARLGLANVPPLPEVSP